MKRKWSSIIKIYNKFFLSNEEYARLNGVKIGENCFLETRNWVSEPYLITIGNNVQITKNVHFHTHGGAHVLRLKNFDFDFFGKIFVDDWAYVGAESHILPGVIIGKGSLVAACSVVTKSIPPDVVVGGNPAKFICTVEEFRKKNLKFNISSKKLSLEDKKELLLNMPDDNFVKKELINTTNQ